ncbi:MAG: DUF1127 domain-containing protein [Azospirillum sp.]|nr:DUF1127 domain-containing protein [Azospirillum sp.]
MVGSVRQINAGPIPGISQLGGVSIAHLVGRWVHDVAEWRQRARQRRALLDLDDHLLEDIGMTREQAVMESRKGFWRL